MANKHKIEVMLPDGTWTQHTCDVFQVSDAGALVFLDANDEPIIGYSPVGYLRYRPVREATALKS